MMMDKQNIFNLLKINSDETPLNKRINDDYDMEL